MNQSQTIQRTLRESDDVCFACGRRLGKNPAVTVVTSDGAQTVYVGRECLKLIVAAGRAGYQPPRGGPRLFTIDDFPGKIADFIRDKIRDMS